MKAVTHGEDDLSRVRRRWLTSRLSVEGESVDSEPASKTDLLSRVG